MASLLDNLKKNMSLAIDKEEVEIQKKIAKHNASSLLGALVGARKTETNTKSEIKRKVAERKDEYREKHNKMFTGYNDNKRTSMVVSRGNSSAVDSPRMRLDGKLVKSQPIENQRYRSDVRLAKDSRTQNTKNGGGRQIRTKEKIELTTYSVKEAPGVVTQRKPSEEYGVNRFSSELKKKR